MFIVNKLGPFEKPFHASCFIRISKHSKTIKALGRFLVFGNPDETLALVYEILRENGLDASISTSGRIKIFPFLVLAFVLCRVKTKHRISTSKFATSGRVWPIKALVPDSPAFENLAEAAVDFDEKCSEVVRNYRTLYDKECRGI